MTVQRDRMREILLELHDRDIFVVVGGPWITVAENWYDGLVDVIFIGEAEETWPQFLREWQQGLHQYRYEQIEKTDMAKVPLPRYDLVKFQEYAMGCVQTSRGCPFQCEFCDIIVIFGRRPRIKTTEMVVAEIDAQHKLGVRVIFLVDDNFIGNKKAAKVILRGIIEWQHQHGLPAGLLHRGVARPRRGRRTDAADGRGRDGRRLHRDREPRRGGAPRDQEVPERPRGGIVERVRKVQDAGMEVYAGMIVGFDSDDETVFERQYDFLQQARIVGAMAGMLSAIPKTPLYARLEAEGRLDNAAADDPNIATNVIPLNMTREAMRDGWLDLMIRLYEAENYFSRFNDLFVEGRHPTGQRQDGLAPQEPVRQLPQDPDPDDPGRPRDARQESGPTPGAGSTARSTPNTSAS